MKKIEIGVLVTIVLAVAGGLVWIGQLQGRISSIERPTDQVIADFRRAGEEIKKELEQRRVPVANAAGAPIGSILPFAGSVENIPNGWLVCDGKSYSVNKYSDLYRICGTLWGGQVDVFFNVPNLNGAFLRGVDFSGTMDRDRKSRGESSKPGSKQDGATAMPKNAFRTVDSGSHLHSFAGVAISSGDWQSGGSLKPGAKVTAAGLTTGDAGNHKHLVEGGDEETRPMNYAVIFIIRAM